MTVRDHSSWFTVLVCYENLLSLCSRSNRSNSRRHSQSCQSSDRSQSSSDVSDHEEDTGYMNHGSDGESHMQNNGREGES